MFTLFTPKNLQNILKRGEMRALFTIAVVVKISADTKQNRFEIISREKFPWKTQ